MVIQTGQLVSMLLFALLANANPPNKRPGPANPVPQIRRGKSRLLVAGVLGFVIQGMALITEGRFSRESTIEAGIGWPLDGENSRKS